MLNKIIKYSLNSRLTVLILTGIVLVVGVLALLRTDIDIFPDLNAPTVVVMTEAPGMAPEEVERTVTYPIETAVNGASGVRRVRSSSTTGFSVVWVEFDWDTDAYDARQIVSERISGLSADMPASVGVPTLGPQSSILGEMMIIGLTADTTSLLDLRDIADRVISPRLLSLQGVSQVSVIGGDAKQYQIRLSSERMRHHGVTLTEVMGAVEGINDNVGGGVLYEYGNEYIVKGDISTDNVNDIALSVVRADDSGVVTIGDIAEVGVGPEQPRLGAASVKGRPSVLITVSKQPRASTIDLTADIDTLLADVRHTLPADVTVSTDIFRQSEFIENSVNNLQRSLFEGALFVVIVLFVFLMNVRTTVISLVALPLSIIVTMLVLHAMGMTINTMSLGGIAIAIGSLVDDAIVDVENVYKRLRDWCTSRDAEGARRLSILDIVYQASAEVRMPIFNSSLIIIASFVPLFFLSGMEGRMLRPLGIAFIVALIASTIVALTVTPVLCSLMLGTKRAMRRLDRQTWTTKHLRAWYSRSLAPVLRHGWVMLAIVGVLAVAAVVMLLGLGRGFLPAFNEGSFTINVSTLPGISLEESDRVGRVAEELIMSVPEITTVARKTGRSELDEHSLGVNVSEIEAPYKLSGRPRSDVVKELRHKLSAIPGANIEIGQPISHRIDAMLSGTEAQIAVKVFGNDLNQLYAIGNGISQALQEVDGVVDVNIEQQIERPQLDIRPRREMLAAYGISMPEFRQLVSTVVGGATVSKVYEDAYPYDLTVVFDDANRSSADALADVSIDTRYGQVPLSAVADIVSATGPNTINRENAKRRLVVSANVQDRDLRSTVEDIKRQVATEITLPEGCYVTYGGQFESEEAATTTLMWASLGALLVIFMLLYHQFHSVGKSLIVLVNMPLAMIGGVLALVITGSYLNIPAVIGFIALLGISTRNGMLLISRYDHLVATGHGVRQAVEIGSSDRLLPIIMTALTSALALIPIAINGHQPGNEIQSPLAIVILGGLVTSTILNIYVVPWLYLKSQAKNSKLNTKS